MYKKWEGEREKKEKYDSKDYRYSINMRDMKGTSRRNRFIDIEGLFRDFQYPGCFDLSHSSLPVVARPNASNLQLARVIKKFW